jgi:hypothetical protein
MGETGPLRYFSRPISFKSEQLPGGHYFPLPENALAMLAKDWKKMPAEAGRCSGGQVRYACA